MTGIFECSEALLGKDAVARLNALHVLIVGVGGVGSWCAEALVRTGLCHLTLMDDDTVAASNVNRQAPATSLTIGEAKVEAMARRLREINPEAEIIAINRRFPPLDLTPYDLVIDAIDSVPDKAQLILAAFRQGVTIFSSMGAALRLDPTRVRVVAFDKVTGDGLARALRNQFRRLGEWPGGFRVVASEEPPLQRNVRGSVICVTAAFGLALAHEAIGFLSHRSPKRAIVALGSNMAPREDYLARARAALEAFPMTRVVAVGEVSETEPVDVPAEFRELKFLNQVVCIETLLGPLDFSSRMHAIEDALGRVRKVRNGPRTIDVDLIDFDGLRRTGDDLTLPHPRALARDFVREPWKALVRQMMKGRRRQVSQEERAARSHALCQRLVGLLGEARVVCAYRALKSELDLTEFVDACRHRGVEVVFPEERAEGDARTFVVVRANEVDLWICPGLAFTMKGERLGFGGGWYDRFLAAAGPKARAFGVAYDFQIWKALPQGPWDRRLNGVVVV